MSFFGGGNRFSWQNPLITGQTAGYSNIQVPVCAVGMSGSINVADSSAVLVTFDTELFDRMNMHSTSSNSQRVNIKVAGNYLVNAQLTWDTNTAGTLRTVSGATNVGGSSLTAGMVNIPADNTSIGLTQNFSGVALYMKPGDFIFLNAFQDSGGTRTITGVLTVIWIGG